MKKRMILHIFLGEEKVQELELSDKVVTIGRDPHSDLVLNDASVSRHHAEIEPSGDFFVIRDSQSTNGTFLNGQPLTDAVVLINGDQMQVGQISVEVGIAPSVRAASPAEAGREDEVLGG